MAAIVRSGARKLARSALLQRAPASGGILQPKPAADGLIQRAQASGPFLARFMSSTEQRAWRLPLELVYPALDQIQVKKEQLYDLIAKSEMEATDRQNRQLLKTLSTQIKPRPNDWRWQKMRALEVIEDVVHSTIPVTGSILTVLAVLQFQLTYVAANKKMQAEAAAAAKQEKLAHA